MAKLKMTDEFIYAFHVWPDETWGFRSATFDFFKMGCARVEMRFTHDEFERFRSSLSHDGFTLREIERWPYFAPERVN
jgi:hypothetical protein